MGNSVRMLEQHYSKLTATIVALFLITPAIAQDIAEIERAKREDLIKRCVRRIHYEWPAHKNEFKFLSARTNFNDVWIKYYAKVKGNEEVHQYWCSFSQDRSLNDARIIE